MDSTIFPAIFVLLYSQVHMTWSEENTTITGAPVPSTTPPAPVHGEDILNRPIDKGMKPIYTMTNFLLETVINPRSVAELAQKVDLTDWGAILDSWQTDWQMWLRHYYGYLICAVFGVVYALTFIIAGISVCCCRAQGKCGAKQKRMDDKNTGHKRRTCASFLLIVLIPLMLGVVALFIANQLTYDETVPSGITNVFGETLRRFQVFQEQTVDDLWREVYSDFEDSSSEISNELFLLPKTAEDNVGIVTNAGPLLSDLSNYVDSLNDTSEALQSMDQVVESISFESNDLTWALDIVRDNMTIELADCSLVNTYCNQTLEIMQSLFVLINASDLENGTASVIAAIQNVTSGSNSIYTGLGDAQREYHTISEVFNASSLDNITSLLETTDILQDEMFNFVNTTSNSLTSINFTDAQAFVDDTMAPWVQYSGDIRYFICIAVGCLIAIIIILFIIALGYGACGERAGPDAECCNRGNSASLLMVTAYLVFGTCWLFILGTSFLIVVGGVAHTDICRHLINVDDAEVLKVIDDIFSVNLDLNISVTETYLNCRYDMTLYTAAGIENWGPEYNVSYILDLDLYGIPDMLDELEKIKYKIGNVTLLNNIVEVNLNTLQAGFETLDIVGYKCLSQQNTTTVDMKDFSLYLRAASNASTGDLKNLFLEYAKEIELLHDAYVLSVRDLQQSLSSNISVVEDLINSTDLPQLMENLVEAQESITPSTMSTGMALAAKVILDMFEDMVSLTIQQVQEDIGRCSTIYSAGADSVTAACIRFLYPFNGFWYSLGWCLFFFIFTIPLAIKLAGYYEKTDKYVPIELAHMQFEPADIASLSVHRERSQRPKAPAIISPLMTTTDDFELQDMDYTCSPIEQNGLVANVNQGYVAQDEDDGEDDDGGFAEYQTQPRHQRQLSTRALENNSSDSQRNRNVPTHTHQSDEPRLDWTDPWYQNSAYNQTDNLPPGEGPAPYNGYHSPYSVQPISSYTQYQVPEPQTHINAAYF